MNRYQASLSASDVLLTVTLLSKRHRSALTSSSVPSPSGTSFQQGRPAYGCGFPFLQCTLITCTSEKTRALHLQHGQKARRRRQRGGVYSLEAGRKDAVGPHGHKVAPVHVWNVVQHEVDAFAVVHADYLPTP